MKAAYPLTPKSGKRAEPVVQLWAELDQRRRCYYINGKRYSYQDAARFISSLPTRAIVFFPDLRAQVGKLVPYLMERGELSGAGDQLRSLHYIMDKHVVYLSDASLYFPEPTAALITGFADALYGQFNVRLAPTPGNTAMRIMRRFLGIKSIWQTGDLIRKLARASLSGGALHWQTGSYPMAYKYDIRSAYASAMAGIHYPIQPRLWSGIPKVSVDGFMFVAEIDYETDNTFSPLVIYGNDDEAYHPTRAQNVLVALNNTDITTLSSVGDLKIKRVISSISWQEGPQILSEVMARMEELQRAYKHLTPAIKTTRNATYGKVAEGDEMSTLTLKLYTPELKDKEIVDILEADEWLFALVREHKYKPAPQHNSLFAGLITAEVRARVYSAIDENTVYVDTDGMISTAPRNLDFGENWGDWRYEGKGQAVILGPRIYGMAGTTKIAGQHKPVSMSVLLKGMQEEIKVAEMITPNPLTLERVKTTQRTLSAIKYPHVEAIDDNLYITRSPTITVRAKIPFVL